MSEQQDMMSIIGGLTLETRVIGLMLIHLIAREAKTSPDAEAWLRAFSDEVHLSIDRGHSQADRHIEESRARIDLFIDSVRLRLTEK